MKQQVLGLVLTVVAALPLATHAQSTINPSTAQTAPDIKTFDQRLAGAQAQITRMQELMDKLRQTQDPQERQRLMHEHYTTMQNAMTAMHGMWGPGMMGGPGRTGWGGVQGYYSKLTPEQLKQRQYMTDQYTGMLHVMMEHMMWRLHWIGSPLAPAETK